MDSRKYLDAILTEAGDANLYMTNVTFRAGIDSLIAMIPIYVDGLKEHARVEDIRTQNAIKALMIGTALQ